MKTRIIHTKMWEDEFFTGLSQDSKLLFVYLISNNRINISGVYEITNRVISFDTGLSAENIISAKKELAGKIKFHNDWVYVINSRKLCGYVGAKNETAAVKELALVEEEVLEKLGVPKFVGEVIEEETEVKKKSVQKDKSGHNSVDYLKSIPKADIEYFMAKFGTTEAFITEKGASVYDWIKSKGKKYKDYKALLRNCLRKDSEKQREKTNGTGKDSYWDSIR